MTERTDLRRLLADEDYQGVVHTVMDNNASMDAGMAQRIVDEALRFVATAAAYPDRGIAPSRVVDEGWHALILHTRAYAGLCEALGGLFIHHQPERPDPSRQDPLVLTRTMVLMEQAGHAADESLWTGPLDHSVPVAANCGHSPKCKVCWNPPPPAPPSQSVVA